MIKLSAVDPWIMAWFAVAAALVAYRSYAHARCGAWEAVFAGAFWPIWMVGMAFRIGEESVGFRWPDSDKESDTEGSPTPPQPSLTFAAPDQTMTAQDKSRFLVDISRVDLTYGDARDIYNLLADKAKVGREA